MQHPEKQMNIRELTRISLCAALICVCAWITVPTVIPFTMQTFAVFFALLLLGGRRGTAAIGVYILLGAAGVPVFSGFRGGAGVLFGATGGYILGFLLTGLLYWLLCPCFCKTDATRVLVLLAGLIACYATGTLWYMLLYAKGGSAMSLAKLIGVCVTPYIIPDIVKLFLAYFLSRRLKRLAV